MGKRKVTKQQIEAAEKGKAKAAKRQARDDAYRAALGLANGAKLPKSIGTMPATGGGRNRRGRVTGGIGQVGQTSRRVPLACEADRLKPPQRPRSRRPRA